MRKKIVAGNWKMNLLKDEAQALTAEILGMLHDEELRDVNVILFPPFIYINTLINQVAGEKRISIGAQNCSDKNSGAYTGEVAAAMLKSVGCKYVLVGHSERRSYYNESNEILIEKTNQVLSNQMTPVFCFGETLKDRESGNHFELIKSQLTETVFKLSSEEFSKIILAYEPVWAIGTGVTASPAQAQEIHFYVRNLIQDHFNESIANNTTILYGGSCNDQNAKELFSLDDVDGGLIGGASLKSRSFINIIKELPA
jgi:triosephosphate isomerase (TIM)